MKRSILLLSILIFLINCSKNDSPPDRTDTVVQEPALDPATAVVTMVLEGQNTVVKVYGPDGKFRWSAPNDKYGGLSIRPSYADGRLYVTFGDSLFSYDIQNGKVFWKKKYSLFPVAAPTAYKGVLYMPGYNTLFELSPSDGSVLKKHSIGGVVSLPLILKDSIVYLLTSTATAAYSINAYDLKNQTMKWQTSIGINPPIGLTLVGDNLIFRNDFTFYLRALDITTGHFAWSRTEIGYSNHVVYGDRIYAVTQAGPEYINLNAIDAKTGSRAWKWIQNKPAYFIRDIYAYRDQLHFVVDEADNKIATIAVKNSNGDSLWRKEGVYTNGVYASEAAGDKLYRYEISQSNQSKIVIYDAKTFAPLDSSIASSDNPFLYMMVVKKSQN